MWQQADRADVSRCFFDIPDYIFCPLDYMQMYENYNLLHYTLPFLLGLILRLEDR